MLYLSIFHDMKLSYFLGIVVFVAGLITACKAGDEEQIVSDTSVADSSTLNIWVNTGDKRIQVPTTDIIKSNVKGLFRVKLDGKYGFVDSTMTVVIPCLYDNMLDFCDMLCGVLVDGKWGFIDTDGKMVIDPKYDWVSSFNEGKAAVVYNGDTLYMWENGEYLDTDYYFSLYE